MFKFFSFLSVFQAKLGIQNRNMGDELEAVFPGASSIGKDTSKNAETIELSTHVHTSVMTPPISASTNAGLTHSLPLPVSEVVIIEDLQTSQPIKPQNKRKRGQQDEAQK